MTLSSAHQQVIAWVIMVANAFHTLLHFTVSLDDVRVEFLLPNSLSVFEFYPFTDDDFFKTFT